MLKLVKNNKQSYDALSSENWVKCPDCGKILSKLELTELNKCPNCEYYFRINVEERINLLLDKDSYQKINVDMATKNVINFPGYSDKVEQLQFRNKELEGVQVGTGQINGIPVALGVMDSKFIMGTLNRVVGERIIQLIRMAENRKLPLILVTVSGGARMQEGIFSLLQMSRIQNELNVLSKMKLPYISLLTDPTMGGVTASFATTADIILGEKGAMLGFAGPRVIRKVSPIKLPKDFQSSETMLKNGFIDLVVERENEKAILTRLLKLLKGGDY